MENLLGLSSDPVGSLMPDTSSKVSDTAFVDPASIPSLNYTVTSNPTADLLAKSNNTEYEGVTDPLEFAANAATLADKKQQGKDLFHVTSYNPELKERYKGDKTIYNDYFDPSADNERVAAENWTKWDAISSGFGSFKDSFSNSYIESAKTWTRAAKALFSTDVDYLAPSETEMDRMAWDQHLSEIANPIFYEPGTEHDFLTKGFLAETIANLGFTFGTLAEVGTEQAITQAVSGLLASSGFGLGAAANLEAVGAASAAAKVKMLPKMWNSMKDLFVGRALKNTETVKNIGKISGLEAAAGFGAKTSTYGSKVAKAFNSGDVVLDKVRLANADLNIMNKGIPYQKTVWDNALKYASKVPFVGEFADAARLSRAGKDVFNSEELLRVGAGAARRSFAEWQLAAGEASIEAGGVYSDLVSQLKNEYKIKYGKEAEGDDLKYIKDQALSASTKDFGTNVAILGITNKLQWGNILGGFNFETAAITRLKNTLAEDMIEKGIVGVQNAAKTKFYQKGLLGTLGLLPKIASDFGKKEAAWEIGRSLLRGVTRIEMSEGIQENLQDITSASLKDYYTDIYKKDVASWGDSFREAVDQQFTKQGAKTFLMGALTGMFIQPVTGSIAYANQRGVFGNSAQAEHYKNIAKSVEELNNFYDKNYNNVLKEQIKQIKLQTMFSNGMLEGLTTKDKFQYVNNRDSAIIQTIMHAKRTGTLGYLTSFIHGYGTSFDNESFKEAFGFSPEEVGKGSAQDVLADLAYSVDAYSQIFDEYQDRYGMRLSVDEYIQDPAKREMLSIQRSALLDAISTASFIESKNQRTVERQASIRDRILVNYPTIGQSLSSSFGTIVSPEKMDNELLILNNELKALRESLAITPDDQTIKDAIASKEQERINLANIKEVMFERKTIEDPVNPGKTIEVYDTRTANSIHGIFPYVAKHISAYLTLKNKQAGLSTVISQSEVNDAMRDIYDYMSLGQDHAEYVDALNMLNDPDQFTKYYQNLMNARAAAHARLLLEDYKNLVSIYGDAAAKFYDSIKDLRDEIEHFANNPVGTFKNLSKLQSLRNQITEKAKEFAGLKETEEKANEEKKEIEKKEAEAKEKAEVEAENSRNPIPVMTLYSEGKEEEVNAYMNMRYNLTDLHDNFPYEEQDRNLRIATRYMRSPDGQRQKLDDVRVMTEMKYTDTDGNPQALPIDNYEHLYTYLLYYEQDRYNKFLRANQKQEQEASAKTEKTDNEKIRLSNYVGQKVMFNGSQGNLEVENGNYVVKFEDGSSTIVGPEKEDAFFSDYVELSPAYHSIDAENQAVVNTNPESAIIDTGHESVVSIVMDESLNTAEINGVKWNIEYDDNGQVAGFNRTFERKKGKKTKTFFDRLSIRNPKGEEYAARINRLLNKISKLPDSEELLNEHIEATQAAIDAADNALQSESMARKKSDELLSELRVRKMENDSLTGELVEIKAKFDNPTTKKSLTQDELIRLFSWADDLAKQIKKTFKIWTTNPVVQNALTRLNKSYINPINDKINGKRKPSSKKVTARVTEKTERARLTAGLAESPKGEPGAAATEQQPERKGRKKNKGLAAVVTQLEMSFDQTPDVTSTEHAEVVAEKDQDLPLQEGIANLSNIAADSLASLQSLINLSKSENVPTTETEKKSNPFDSLKNNQNCKL